MPEAPQDLQRCGTKPAGRHKPSGGYDDYRQASRRSLRAGVPPNTKAMLVMPSARSGGSDLKRRPELPGDIADAPNPRKGCGRRDADAGRPFKLNEKAAH